jgi:hypothetical protein
MTANRRLMPFSRISTLRDGPEFILGPREAPIRGGLLKVRQVLQIIGLILRACE